jgi:hypothetical protein
MRLFRLIVVLANLLTLPGYGLAASGHVGGCPERGTGAASATHAMDMSAMDMSAMHMGGMDMAGMATSAHHGCCPGTSDPKPASTPHEGCPACGAGHGCKGTPGAQAFAAPVLHVLPLNAAVIDEPAPHASLCGPDGLLRPPNLA